MPTSPSSRQFKVSVQEVNDAGAVISPPTRWTIKGDDPLGALENLVHESAMTAVPAVVAESDDLPSESAQVRQLGQDLLEIAALCDVPLSYYRQDARIARAARAMGMSPQAAYEWTRRL